MEQWKEIPDWEWVDEEEWEFSEISAPVPARDIDPKIILKERPLAFEVKKRKTFILGSN